MQLIGEDCIALAGVLQTTGVNNTSYLPVWGGALVLVGDPGRSYLARERLEPVAEYRVPVTRALEDSEIKKTQVWKFRSG